MYTVDTQGTSMPKDAGFRIRVDDSLRAEFIAACKRRDRTAAQVLRDFMRRYIEGQEEAVQGDLFCDATALTQRTNDQQ